MCAAAPAAPAAPIDPIAVIDGLSKSFAGMDKPALSDFSGQVFPGQMTGLVGPDGAGKTTLIRLLVGLLRADAGSISVNGFNAASQASRIHAITGYMPQKFGLYEDLSVMENLRLYADLRHVTGAERAAKFARLLKFTDLQRFQGRLAGKLSGGMKQKLGLACALIGDPLFLLLDEPSVGVDPISRRELWSMVKELLSGGMAVLWSTSYLDEAEKCDTVLLLNQGVKLHDGPPAALLGTVQGRTWQLRGVAEEKRREALMGLLRQPGVRDGVIQGRHIRIVTAPDGPEPVFEGLSPQVKARAQGGATVCPIARPGAQDEEQALPGETPSCETPSVEAEAEGAQTGGVHDGAEGTPHVTWHQVPPWFEDAFIDLLGGGPGGDSALAEKMSPKAAYDGPVIDARGLTKRFGDFTAVRDNSFQIRRGEIFGLLGPNGAGKSTTFKMMCGLLQPSEGQAFVTGLNLKTATSQARSRIGYMAQKFSLYSTLNVLQNLRFFSGLYGLSAARQRERVELMLHIFELKAYASMNAGLLPLGFKQRLALACAVMHEPDVLFLDEPTSGVDPITRREFWTHINAMVEKGVTVMVTTHFMDEAEYCDRIGLIYRGENIATGSPDDLKDMVRSPRMPEPTLEDAFIALVEQSDAARETRPETGSQTPPEKGAV